MHFFFGGWYRLYPFFNFSGSFMFALKIIFFITLFVLVRGTLPRYRYDQLIRLGWKIFLPISLLFIIFYSSYLCAFNSFIELCRLIKKMLLYIHIFIDLGLILSFIAAFGIYINKCHILLSVICIEIRFYGLNLFLVIIALYLDDIRGEVFALFILTLAAAESALALALITVYFRVYGNIILVDELANV